MCLQKHAVIVCAEEWPCVHQAARLPGGVILLSLVSSETVLSSKTGGGAFVGRFVVSFIFYQLSLLDFTGVLLRLQFPEP